MDEDVAQFLSVTGLDSEHVARGYLEISGNDPMQAIQLFFENPDLASSFTAQPDTASAAPAPAAPPAASMSSSRSVSAARGLGGRGLTAGREDARGVIHIDSDGDDDNDDDDDDDDVDMDRPAGDRNHITIPDDPDERFGGQDHRDIAAVARAAQEEEDAAMARRLQDDMYSQDPASADGVRAPMARTTETLVAPEPSWSIDDDREAAVLEQLRRRRQPRAARPPQNPFSQSVWDDPGATGGGDEPVMPMASHAGGGGGPAAPTSRSQRLADLFRPPFDIMSHLAWDDARQEGKEEKKWIMVNVQDMSDFNCQALNRDHWKDANIKALLREHFIFLQYEKGDPLSQTYTSFYFHGFEDRDNYPYVSIIDPRTGEQVKTWSGLPFPDAAELHSDLVEFLDRYSLAANSKNPVPTSKPKATAVDYGRMTEEEMMEMALRNSLEANGGPSRPGVQDPDELTRAQAEAAAGASASGSGSGAAHSPALPPAAASPFEQISATHPHTEPPNDPATTTRIQFRHPAGRVIRRFAVDDAVRRIYEWLKAEGLEGTQGVPFELKANPGGDLIDRLDMTIGEAGLKQGTVMIEFIEEDA